MIIAENDYLEVFLGLQKANGIPVNDGTGELTLPYPYSMLAYNILLLRHGRLSGWRASDKSLHPSVKSNKFGFLDFSSRCFRYNLLIVFSHPELLNNVNGGIS